MEQTREICIKIEEIVHSRTCLLCNIICVLTDRAIEEGAVLVVQGFVGIYMLMICKEDCYWEMCSYCLLIIRR